MSIESMKEDGIYIEDPQKTKEIKDALNSDESAFADIKSKEDKGIILKSDDGRVIFISEDKIFAIDKYGNVMKYSDGFIHYKQNSPTYDELYEHWLKTKDKPKRKRKKVEIEQLPGQIDLFDIIDMEEK